MGLERTGLILRPLLSALAEGAVTPADAESDARPRPAFPAHLSCRKRKTAGAVGGPLRRVFADGPGRYVPDGEFGEGSAGVVDVGAGAGPAGQAARSCYNGRRRPAPSVTGATATYRVATRSAPRNRRMAVTPPPRRTPS